ncbi:MAG: hypothetical protein ABIG11_05805, partial [bacterium]
MTKPEDGVVISTADLTITGSVVDTESKVGVVTVSLFAAAPCQFHHDLFGIPVASSSISGQYCTISGQYCSAWNYEWYLKGTTWYVCNADIGTVANFDINHDLLDYVDFSHGQDCDFVVGVGGSDRVGTGPGGETLSFIVDQMPPVISISNWPGPVLISTPAIAGMAADSSEITSIKLRIFQRDWPGNETYWNGADWVADSNTVVNVDLPQSTNTINWSYDALTSTNMISGSYYKLTVYAADKYNHVNSAEKEFNYDACPTKVSAAELYKGEDVFEVGAAVFRQMD